MTRRKARPIITLTTDFGGSDHYAACMKGVILSIALRQMCFAYNWTGGLF